MGSQRVGHDQATSLSLLLIGKKGLGEKVWGNETAFLVFTVCVLSHVQLCTLPGFFDHGIFQARVPEWPFPSPGDLPDPGIEPTSPALQADALPSEPPGKSWENFSYTNGDL